MGDYDWGSVDAIENQEHWQRTVAGREPLNEPLRPESNVRTRADKGGLEAGGVLSLLRSMGMDICPGRTVPSSGMVLRG